MAIINHKYPYKTRKFNGKKYRLEATATTMKSRDNIISTEKWAGSSVRTVKIKDPKDKRKTLYQVYSYNDPKTSKHLCLTCKKDKQFRHDSSGRLRCPTCKGSRYKL